MTLAVKRESGEVDERRSSITAKRAGAVMNYDPSRFRAARALVRNVVADDYCNSNDFRRRSAAERAIGRTKTADLDDN